ncbi:hypothetical protein FH972_003551 [Carpinus fangiana]|uniref:Aminopeptidase n=1 Tax=Carpinus fangiana TaxID=176857 RepID=A0A5N6QK80_9ROSI|nr:hypothetical protein FH972_003551 [Carpinus fangiana]
METKQFKGQARLPEFAIPKRYDISLKTDLSECTFSGTVQVNLNILEDTRFLVLNALELVIHQVWYTSSSHNQTYRPCDVVLDGDDETLVLVFDEVLGVGEGVLGIEFSAALNEHLKGFYRWWALFLFLFFLFPIFIEDLLSLKRRYACNARKLLDKILVSVHKGSFPPVWELRISGKRKKKTKIFNFKSLVKIHHARSIIEVFDDISYKKGSAVIRMLQGFLGDHMFQKSLSSYMRRFAGKNTKTEDLWSILSEESGVQVNSTMDAWTKQKGYPVISVKSKYNILEFEQLQLLSSGSCDDRLWIVPITLSIGSYNRRKTFLLETKFRELDISELVHSPDENSSSIKEKNRETCDEHLWVKVNTDQSGFYRVKYEDKLAAQLRKAVESNYLSPIDKFGVLDDMYALCEACKESLSSLLSLMDVYRKELDYVVVSKLIEVFYEVVKISGDAIPDLVNELKQFFINLLLFSSEKSGWESISGESHLSALLRGRVFLALATFGHDKTHKEAIRRFQTLLNDRNTPLLSADTRKAAYVAVILNTNTTNRSGFDSLLNIYREADTVQEKEPVLRHIASCPDPTIVLEALNFMMSDEVRHQDITYVLGGISSEGREVAWRWLKENWELIFNKYGTGILMHRFITNIVTLVSISDPNNKWFTPRVFVMWQFCSNEKADEIEEFFESRTHPSFGMNLKRSIERVRVKARWVENIKREQSLQDLLKRLAHSSKS